MEELCCLAAGCRAPLQCLAPPRPTPAA